MEKRNMQRKRQGFTLIEVVVSAAIGSIVIGSGMLMYLQGNKYFYKVTEHSSFRAESLIILERIAQDLDQIQVSTSKNPATGKFYLTQPYEFIDPFTMDVKDEDGNVIETVAAGKGLRFYRFHHIKMGAPKAGVPNGVPTMVGHRLEYTVRAINASKPALGYNVYRNDKKINSQPLQQFFFHQEPMIVAANQVQGSKAAIITTTVVPKGGLFGNMDYNTVQRLQEEGSIVSRTFHLIGYESFYTSVLYSALQKQSGNGGTLTGIDALQQAVLADAAANTPANLLTNLEATVGSSSPPTHLIPGEAFAIEANIAFDDVTASSDSGWLAAPETPGRPAGAGEFSFEDNGAGPGSGSGSGSGSASGSASGSGGSGC
jgi:prepilin-type N-terminal cleavage/methylation domain-containing protein